MPDNKVTIGIDVEGKAEKIFKDIAKALDLLGKEFGEIKKGFRSLDKASEQAEKSIKQTNSALKKSQKAFQDTSRFLDNLAANLASAAIQAGFRALTNSITEAGEAFLEFDAAIAEVNTLLPGTAKLTKETTDAFIRFSAQFGTTASGQAKAFYQIVSAGTSDVVKATKLLESANKAAIAGITDTQTAVDGLTSILNAYGEDVIDTTTASDVLFTAIKEGKTTFSELASTIGRVNPIAAAAGVSFQEVSATLAFLTKSGVSTDEATTSLRAAIVSLLKPTEGQLKAAKKLGIEFGAAALKSKGFAGVMQDVLKATGGSTEKIAELFPNVRAITAVVGIAGKNFGEFQRILSETAKASGATGDAFAKVTESASFQLKTLQASIAATSLQMFSDLEPAFTIILKSLKETASSFDAVSINAKEFIEVFKTILTIGDSIATGFKLVFGTIKTAFLGIIALVVNVVDGIAKAITVINELASAIPGIDAPFQSLQVTTGLLAESINEDLNKAFEDTKSALSDQTVFATLRDNIGAITEGQKELAAVTAESNEIIAASMEDANPRIAASIESLTDAEKKFVDSIVQGSQTVIQKEQEKLKKLITLNKKNLADKRQVGQAIVATEKKISDQVFADQRASLNQIASLQTAKSKELRGIGKAAAISETIIATHAGAAKALSAFAFFPPLAFAMAALITAAGLARVASIAGTPLQQGITSVPEGFQGDTFPARLSTGERVITQAQNEDLTLFLASQRDSGDTLRAILGVLMSQNQQVNVNIGGEQIIDAIQDQVDGGRQLAV